MDHEVYQARSQMDGGWGGGGVGMGGGGGGGLGMVVVGWGAVFKADT